MMTMSRKKTADEVYEVVDVSEGHPVGGIVSVRLKPEEFHLLATTADQRGLTLSETLRLGLRCLAAQPSDDTAPPAAGPQVESRGGSALVEFPAKHEDWSRCNG
jgi:hypothetical protein